MTAERHNAPAAAAVRSAAAPNRPFINPALVRAEGEGEPARAMGTRALASCCQRSLGAFRICLLSDPELEPGGSRDFRSACFYG